MLKFLGAGSLDAVLDGVQGVVGIKRRSADGYTAVA